MKRSVILTDRLGPDILLVLTMKRQVLHRERAHLKVPGCSLVFIGPQITDDTTLHSHNTVITIPENLPLTDSEKSVLSKGLNFVPITKLTNEFSIKQDVEKFLRRVQLKAFFHDKEDDSDTSNKDIFETLLVRKSKWTPPEGQFASLDFFTKKCRHDIHKLKFNRNTKFSNLSSEEWAALKNLSKRNDIVVKSADKGGAVVVWRSRPLPKRSFAATFGYLVLCQNP